MDVCPRTCPTEGASSCKYLHSLVLLHVATVCAPSPRAPCQPSQVLQLLCFRLGCHTLPSATGQRRNARVRATRSAHLHARCQHGLRDEKHLVSECTKLQHIRDRYARLFEGCDTMRSFMIQGSQKDVNKFVSDCLDCDAQLARWRGSTDAASRGGRHRSIDRASAHLARLRILYFCAGNLLVCSCMFFLLMHRAARCIFLLFSVVCTTYAQYTFYPDAACTHAVPGALAPVDRP